MNRHHKSRGLGMVGHALALVIALGVGAPTANAQVQRKPKGPTPPSYEDLMQRALNEKKAASNAPVTVKPVTPVTPPPPKIPAATNAATPSQPAISADELLRQAKAAKPAAPTAAPAVTPPVATQITPPPAVTATPASEPKPTPAVVQTPAANAGVPGSVPANPPVPPPVVHTEKASPTPAISPSVIESGKATETAKSKGPVFSPLPPDLAPANEAPAGFFASSRGSAPVAGDSTNAMDNLDDKHLLAIGDRLSFRIVEDEDDPRSLTVMDSGELEVPYIGRFNAVGKSCKELAKALKSELEKEYYRKATVIVAVDQMARTRGRIYIVGAVRVPGAQEIPSDEVLTLSKAILRAGGFTDFADKKSVKITRKAPDGVNENHITVDVSEILEKGRTSADVPLLPGDLIYVPERLIRF